LLQDTTAQIRVRGAFVLKLEAPGFGVFVPFFFVTSGVRFNLHALFAKGSTIARVPIFVLALRPREACRPCFSGAALTSLRGRCRCCSSRSRR
jgi:hypothetical protein